MGVDEAGQKGLARAVDHRGAGDLQFADSGDLAVLHQDIARPQELFAIKDANVSEKGRLGLSSEAGGKNESDEDVAHAGNVREGVSRRERETSGSANDKGNCPCSVGLRPTSGR